MAVSCISEVNLSNFKAFDRFRMNFTGDAFLVGPNNAGKSTLISAVRSAAQMLRLASNKPPDRSVHDEGVARVGYSLSADRVGLVEDNLRHEFHNVDTRLKVKFSTRASIAAVWPADREQIDDDIEENVPFFYLDVPDGRQPRRPKEVRESFPSVGIIPILSPVEQAEGVLTDSYVRQSSETRLTSRHFRNQLLQLQNEELSDERTMFEEFLGFARPWVPELEIVELRTRPVPGEGYQLDLFYREPGRRALKEIVWAGDGIQVWLQLLFHLFRLRSSQIVVLDEPDLYLHADLQRRLVRLLEEMDCQIITATHSPEMLAEAANESIVWVDKSRRVAVRSPKESALTDLARAIGSQFNIRLAKALRSRVVLFVEGKDMKILASLAKAAGATKLSSELGIAVIPLEGFTNWEHVEPFKWLVDEFLSRAVEVFVILDRDFRPPTAVARVLARLKDLDIAGHVWARKELESYLLVPECLARVSKAPLAFIEAELDRVAEGMRTEVFARCLDEEQRYSVSGKKHRVNVTQDFSNAFDQAWRELAFRLHSCPAKDLLHALNARLADSGYSTVSPRQAARAMKATDLTDEMRDLFLQIEASA